MEVFFAMKIFWILCFSFAIIFAAMGQPAEMVIEHRAAQPGENVCLSVKICSSVPMRAVQCGIKWDADILEFTELRKDSIENGPAHNMTEEGILRILHIPFNRAFDSLSFYICFNVIGDLYDYSAVKFYNIPNNQEAKLPIEIVNSEAEALEFTTENGHIFIGSTLDSPPIAKCIDAVDISLPGVTTFDAMQFDAGSYDDESSTEALQFAVTLLDEPSFDPLHTSFGQQKEVVLDSDNSCSCAGLVLHIWDEANQHSSCNVQIQVDDPLNRCKPIYCHTPLEIGVQEFETFHFNAIDLIASNNFREQGDVFVSINDGDFTSSFDLSLEDEGSNIFTVYDSFIGDTCQGTITVVPSCINNTCRNSISFDRVDVLENDTFSMRLHFFFEDTIGYLELPISWDQGVVQLSSVDISGIDIDTRENPPYEDGVLKLEFRFQRSILGYYYQEAFVDSVFIDFTFIAVGTPGDSSLIRIANGFDQEYYVRNKNYETIDYQRTSGIVHILADATMSVLERIRPESIPMFPNPASDYISITLENKDIGSKIEVYNVFGHLEYTERVLTEETKISLDLLSTKGIKFLYINSNYSGRFISQ